jgi:hypothetical protein
MTDNNPEGFSKDAIRSAAVGQDFGADTAEFDPQAPVTEAVEQDKRGTLMLERESYERIVEGLKKASDGARHMARWKNPDLWNSLAAFLDQLRRAVVKESGFDRSEDGRDSLQVFGGDGLTWSDANTRILTGLKDAGAGARQIALGQRMDLRWTRYANQFDRMRDKAHDMAMASSPLKVAAQWGGGSAATQ